jgi:pimeloyl-ACP methyl ester carboxylesterase
MARQPLNPAPASVPVRVRRGYFECRYGQLHVHHAMPPGGGFEEGTPLLCLHECPGSARAFIPFMALAGRDRSVYAPDLPGFGESDPPGTPVAVADYAAALGDFIEHMRLRRLDLLAVRNGAQLALALALLRPAQIARVVIAPAPARGAGERPPGGEAPEWQRALSRGLADYPPRERLTALTAKVLVLRPADEPAETTARTREALPVARVHDLGAPGAELPAGAPERLFEVVRDFLRG